MVDKRQCLATYAEAQELRVRGALVEARDKLVTCSQTSCPGPIVHDCATWLTEVDASLPSVVFAVSDAAGHDISEARVHANGRLLTERTDGRALSLDPGSYTFMFEAEGFATAERTLAMRQSEKNRIVRVQLVKLSDVTGAGGEAPPVDEAAPNEPSHFRVPVASIVLGATAVAAVGAFAYFGLAGRNKLRQLDRCTVDCGDLITTGKRDYVIADVSLGVGVLAAGSAVLIAVLSHDGAEHADTPPSARRSQLQTPQLAIGLGHATLTVSF
ncbi:MAG: carboxypeptidase-like regulatory domain-containing protein [Polyangiales bacterium]